MKLREFNVVISKKDNGVYLVDTYGYCQKGTDRFHPSPKHDGASVHNTLGEAVDNAIHYFYEAEGDFA